MVWLAGTIPILSRQSRSIVTTLSFAATLTLSHCSIGGEARRSEEEDRFFGILHRVAGHVEKGRKAGLGCAELRTGELVVCVDSERHRRLGDCRVKGGRDTDGRNDTLRPSRSSRRAVRTLWRSAASGLADLEVDNRSDNSEWIRQCSVEFSAVRITTLRFFVFHTARRSSRINFSNRHRSNTLMSVWVIGFLMSRTIVSNKNRELLLLSSCSSTSEITSIQHPLCPFTLPLPPLASSSLLVCSVDTAFSLSSMAVDSLIPCSSALQTAFRDILSLSECEVKDHLEFHLTRSNIVPILFLLSLRRVVRRSRCALTGRSTCPHWTCCCCWTAVSQRNGGNNLATPLFLTPPPHVKFSALLHSFILSLN
ncbi:hypothetical protein BLNAU_11971 [Blattamonas nauphoetae]|uniref:Secreted protein n=1 Tax=Blattamonas nauphoetae TaxID=2049346 RepID=A0ABQ9XNL9_9EUKA|nr:hypothetical protein BLNAU_11971 [Blattamonas nauphoetae]